MNKLYMSKSQFKSKILAFMLRTIDLLSVEAQVLLKASIPGSALHSQAFSD